MSGRLQLAAHLSAEEIFQRYRASARISERTHWQVLWMLSRGFVTEEIATAVGYNVFWVRKLIGRYNDGGPDAMRDRRRENQGAEALLSAADQRALAEALEQPPAEGDAWSGPLVARWMSARLGRPVARQRGWEMLHHLGYSPQRPRPRHTGADPEAQEAFKSGAA